jgi:hypothetical protein
MKVWAKSCLRELFPNGKRSVHCSLPQHAAHWSTFFQHTGDPVSTPAMSPFAHCAAEGATIAQFNWPGVCPSCVVAHVSTDRLGFQTWQLVAVKRLDLTNAGRCQSVPDATCKPGSVIHLCSCVEFPPAEVLYATPRKPPNLHHGVKLVVPMPWKAISHRPVNRPSEPARRVQS